MTIDETPDNVRRLPVKFKQAAPPGRSLVYPHEVGQTGGCTHSPLFGCSYIVDDALEQVTCSGCAERLNPMWVLRQLCAADHTYHEAGRRYHEEMRRLKERTRTKCQHCGQMTRISQR